MCTMRASVHVGVDSNAQHCIMHQECNMGESVISTCMGFPSKTKDNRMARQDLSELCNHPSLELKVNGGKPCVSFWLKPQ
jgi:hypothetical protein